MMKIMPGVLPHEIMGLDDIHIHKISDVYNYCE